ncbi:FecR family protein [Acetobacter cibinongensis]|uniref:Uncharacterized protein n=1 Tax=Acetobacter cibinongensis TaxID=146475 RepID=A0A1Z5YT13_9PROT|nr:DUF4880 domain-containing protein [Acetobacter cibinongensis]OUJ01419.1 hypothetical protein HK14_09635 [Acetobacter cibinongensis]
MQPTHSQTESQKRTEDAAHWVTLSDARALTPDEQKKLNNWLQADTRNLGAFVQAKSHYQALDYRSGLRTAVAPALTATPRRGRRYFLAGACAAGFAGLLAPSATRERFALRHRGRQAPQRYDWHGNQITVDARSGAYFASTPRHDALMMAEGRIGLQVQHLPVQVTAGAMWLGSKKADFDISVQEQAVVVALYSGTLNWQSNEKSLTLTSPSILHFSQTAGTPPVLISRQDLSDENAFARKAWRNGQIIMNNYTLAEAVSEFNRYSDVQCLIASPALAQRRVSGSFNLLKLQDFASATALLLNCKIQQEKNRILFYT